MSEQQAPGASDAQPQQQPGAAVGTPVQSEAPVSSREWDGLLRLVLGIVLFLAFVGWLVVIAGYLNSTPTFRNGVQIANPWERVMLVMTGTLLPLVTLVLGYLFGNSGKAQAEKRAGEAQSDAQAAKVMGFAAAAAADPQRLQEVMRTFPGAFGLGAPAPPVQPEGSPANPATPPTNAP